jgi:hypothetical protein
MFIKKARLPSTIPNIKMHIYHRRLVNKLVVVVALALPILVHAKPDENKLKYWLGNETVVVQKGALYDTKEPMNISNISGFTETGNKKVRKLPRSTETITFELDYMSAKLKKTLKCSGAISYSWETKKMALSEDTLVSALITCH